MTPSRQRFETWIAAYLWRHPILASDVQILPGLRLRELVVAAVEQAWEEALRQTEPASEAVRGAEERQKEPPPPAPLHLAPPPAPERVDRRRAAWTPERRAAASEAAKARIASRRFGAFTHRPRPEEDPEWPG